jgi:hypothetical protein
MTLFAINRNRPCRLIATSKSKCVGAAEDRPALFHCPNCNALYRSLKPKLVLLSDRIAKARRIIDAQQMLLEDLRATGAPTHEAEGALRTYASSLMHLLAHECKLKEKAEAKKGEPKLKRGHKKA